MGIVESMKASMLRQAGKYVGSLVRNSSTENIGRLFGTVAALTKEPTKSGLKKLTQMAKEEHPMIVSWQNVFKRSSPKAVEKAMTNLVVNEFALGEKIRHRTRVPRTRIVRSPSRDRTWISRGLGPSPRIHPSMNGRICGWRTASA